jgi:hypothetical protein
MYIIQIPVTFTQQWTITKEQHQTVMNWDSIIQRSHSFDYRMLLRIKMSSIKNKIMKSHNRHIFSSTLTTLAIGISLTFK